MLPTHNTIPYTKTPVATWTIIGLCATVFAYQLSLSTPELQAFLYRHALVPARYTSGDFATAQGLSRRDLSPFLTNMFMHGGVLHILGNMWVLWVFGPALEDRLGTQRYTALYLLSGFAAGLLHMVFNFASPMPALGASGAIAGVIAAYARRFPYAWVNVLQPIGFLPVVFAMPALAFGALWFALQLMQAGGSLLMPGAGGIAWWAHIGGFLAGWVLQGRLSPPIDPAEERRTAMESWMWPWRAWSRWARWWWR